MNELNLHPLGALDALKAASEAANDAPDDGYIIAVGRAAQANGVVMRFQDNEEVEGGIKVTATLTWTMTKTTTVPLMKDVAHGRRLALEGLLS